jgi:hypothetical protein
MRDAIDPLPHMRSCYGQGQIHLILHRVETDKAYFECGVA